MNLSEKIKILSKKYFSQALEIRRHIHQNPELSFKEYNTSKYIQEKLNVAGITFESGIVNTGIVAIIQGKNPEKKTILLRADMDALPIAEKNDVPYKSVNENIMHACGHDVHTACVLGASFILNELKNDWEGTIKIMFQPGEEMLPGGAKLMIEQGILENPKVEKAFALHVFPNLEAGKVGFKKGMYMASTDEIYLKINGKGGHAAMPKEYINPLLIASEILLEIDKRFMQSPQKIPTVVAFGKIEGRGATNVIPEYVEIAGTVRTMDENWHSEIHRQLNEIVKTISNKHGVLSEINIVNGYPFLSNDEALTDKSFSLAKIFLGEENVSELPIRMTAEDFAFISQKVPSCFFRLGTAGKNNTFTSGVHSPTFNVEESAIETGMGLLPGWQ